MTETLSLFWGGVMDVITDPIALLYVAGGVLAGTIVGMIPGLGPSTAIALLLPLAMTLDPSNALIMMVAIYLGAEYGGRISSILLNMPGDAGAIMTTLDGYPMARRGEGARALQISATASFVGSILSIGGLVLLVAPLSRLAISFGPAEYFAVVVMALVLTSTLVGAGIVKSLLAVVCGLMLATVGIDSQTGNSRFTFGVQGLLSGIDVVIVIIGLFGIGEILHAVACSRSEKIRLLSARGRSASMQDLVGTAGTMLRGSVMGFISGVLPGSGTTLGAFLGYSVEKRMAKNPQDFGTGLPRGVAAPEAANNAAVGGALVPTLALGIPGSGVTAVLLAYLMMYGLDPGPTFFQSQSTLAWLIIGSLAISAIVGFILNYPLAPVFSSILKIPSHYLYAFILLVAMVSAYGLHGSLFDAFLVVIFGILGFFLRMVGLSSALVVIGIVLGEMLEQTLRQAILLAKGSVADMLLHPLPMTFLGIAVAAVFFDLFVGKRVRRRLAAEEESATENREDQATQPQPAPTGSEDSHS